MANQQSSLSDFERDVAGRFGLAPRFFSSAPEAPEVIEKLWAFAQAAYLDNPMPSIFKHGSIARLKRGAGASLHSPSRSSSRFATS